MNGKSTSYCVERSYSRDVLHPNYTHSTHLGSYDLKVFDLLGSGYFTVMAGNCPEDLHFTRQSTS